MSNCVGICVSTVKIDSFYKYALAMLKSMYDNSKLECDIIIFYDNLDDTQRKALKTVNPYIKEFRKIPTEKYARYGKNSGGWYVLECWNIKYYDKVLILDSDFICQGDISKIFETDEDIAMCKESTGLYNAGLVLLDKKVIEEGWYFKMLSCDHKIIRLGGNRDDFSKDQKLINYFFKDRIKPLMRTYNWLIDKDAHGAKMVHYIYKPLYDGGLNQLHANDSRLVDLWWKYYNLAEKTIQETNNEL